MDAEKFASILRTRGKFPALVDNKPVFLTNQSTVGAMYISARGFMDELSKRNLKVDEVTLEISSGEQLYTETDPKPSAPVAPAQEPPAEWEGISSVALKKIAKAKGVSLPSSPTRDTIIAALKKAKVQPPKP